jgi:Tol biopolymer transport system component
VKILDFGLAKLRFSDESANEDRTQQRGTSPGTVMGTAGYMSPEQVRGRVVDHRSDIFSFGSLLYEMLSGRRAFYNSSSIETMNAVLNEDPQEVSGSALSHQISPALDRIIRRCLEKSPDERFQSASDLAFALDTASSPSISHDRLLAAPAARPGRRFGVLATVLTVAGAVVGASLTYVLTHRNRPAVRTEASQITFDAGMESSPSIAPDGKTFAFVKGELPHRHIFVQRVDGRSAIDLSRSAENDDYDPAFSPDGNQIAFRSERDGGGIFVMGATGESVRRLTSAGYNPSWSPDGSEIIFASEGVTTPTSRSSMSSLSIVKVATGETRKVFAGDAMQPGISPHAKRILYWGLPPEGGQRDIYTVALSGDPKTVVPLTDDAPLDWNAIWSPDGNSVLFVSDRGGTMNLWRVAVDEESGKPKGAPEPVGVPATSAGMISVARDGRHLLYAAESTTAQTLRGELDPTTGRITTNAEPVLAGSILLRSIEPSPDGKWIAFTTEGREDVYVMRADGSDLRQLTNDPARDRGVSWAPDNATLFFYSARSGTYDVWSIRIDGSGLTQRTKGGSANFPAVSPDGKRAAFLNFPKGTRIAAIAGSAVSTFDELPPVPEISDPFWPTGWSPDGTRITGTTWSTNETNVVVYSIASRSYRVVSREPGRPLKWNNTPVRFAGNDHLLLASATEVFIIDLRTNTRRSIGKVPNASFDRNGRYFVTASQTTESDVWQIALSDDTR